MVSCNKGKIEIVGNEAEIKTDLVCIISALTEDKKTIPEKAEKQAELLTEIAKGLRLANHLY